MIEAVPEGLQNVILSRIDRFGEKLKNVLRTASVIGRLFNRRLLAHCLGHGDELERELEELEDRSMIYLERAIPEEEYSFKHVLTREAAYQSILLSERRRLHLEVARRMETMYSDVLENYYDELAYHYERSTDVEKTIEYLLKKGEKARKAYSNEEAAQAFQSALDTADWGGSPWRRGINLISLSYFYENRKDLEKAGKFAQDAIDLSIGIDDILLESRARVMLASVLGRQNDFESAIEEQKKVVELGLANSSGNYAATWSFIHLSRSYRKVGKVRLALENRGSPRASLASPWHQNQNSSFA